MSQDKRRPRIGEELMEFFEEKKQKPNQPLDELLKDESILDELKDEFTDKNSGEDKKGGLSFRF